MRGMLRADLRRAFGVGIWYTAGAMLVLQFMCLLDFLPSAYDSVVALIDYSTGIGRFQSLSTYSSMFGLFCRILSGSEDWFWYHAVYTRNC